MDAELLLETIQHCSQLYFNKNIKLKENLQNHPLYYLPSSPFPVHLLLATVRPGEVIAGGPRNAVGRHHPGAASLLSQAFHCCLSPQLPPCRTFTLIALARINWAWHLQPPGSCLQIPMCSRVPSVSRSHSLSVSDFLKLTALTPCSKGLRAVRAEGVLFSNTCLSFCCFPPGSESVIWSCVLYNRPDPPQAQWLSMCGPRNSSLASPCRRQGCS